MVKAAYSSGTPALGVGAGNAPVWVCPDADMEAVAACVVDSKAYDNGLICGAEQHLVVDVTVVDGLVAALEARARRYSTGRKLRRSWPRRSSAAAV